jgi:hypothetical protein
MSGNKIIKNVFKMLIDNSLPFPNLKICIAPRYNKQFTHAQYYKRKVFASSMISKSLFQASIHQT